MPRDNGAPPLVYAEPRVHGLRRSSMRDLAVLRALGVSGSDLERYAIPQTTPPAPGSRGTGTDTPDLEEPMALARRMARIMQADHSKLDMADRDHVYDEMSRDSIVRGGTRRLDTGIAKGLMQVDEADGVEGATAHKDYTEEIWDQSERPFRTLKSVALQSYLRGFALAETIDGSIDAGEFRGHIKPSYFRHMKRPSYRLMEDGYGRAFQLEIIEQVEEVRPAPGSVMLSGSLIQSQQVVLDEWNTPEKWGRYVFATTPEDSVRLEGDGAYVTIWPHWFFRQYLWQWIRLLCERHGTPTIIAQLDPPVASAMIGAGQYPVQHDQVLNLLEKIQTAFRGVLPQGWQAIPLQSGVEGLAAMLVAISQENRAEIEVGITGEQVGSGAEAALGTMGANTVILEGTFGGLVVERQQYLASMIHARNRRYLRLNFGPLSAYPRVSFANPNREEDDAKFARVRAGVQDGVYARHEPWLRTEYGDGPSLEDVAADSVSSRQLAERVGVVVQEQDTRPFNQVALRETLFDLENDAIGVEAARAALALQLPHRTRDEVDAIVQEIVARRAAREAEEGEAVDEAEGKLEITPTDLASITSVNEGRASAGLTPLLLPDGSQDPDGDLTIAEFRAQREAKGEAGGEAVGAVEGAQAAAVEGAA